MSVVLSLYKWLFSSSPVRLTSLGSLCFTHSHTNCLAASAAGAGCLLAPRSSRFRFSRRVQKFTQEKYKTPNRLLRRSLINNPLIDTSPSPDKDWDLPLVKERQNCGCVCVDECIYAYSCHVWLVPPRSAIRLNGKSCSSSLDYLNRPERDREDELDGSETNCAAQFANLEGPLVWVCICVCVFWRQHIGNNNNNNTYTNNKKK